MILTQFFQNIPADLLERSQNLNLQLENPYCNKDIDLLLQKTVLKGGKRLRPLLTLLMGRLLGVESHDLIAYARCIEFVHAASLSHDDVIDNATTRRGRPSINVLASNKRAVLAGDYLLSSVIVELTRLGRLDLTREMSYIISQLSQGEWLQLKACEDRQYSREVIKQIALYKTASVMSWCCFTPAYLKNLNTETIELTRQFGIELGMSFQMMDDVIDFSGQSKKDYLLDLENGVINSVLFEWLELNPEIKKRFAKGESIISMWNQNNIADALKIVEANAKVHIDRAHELLNRIVLKVQDNHQTSESLNKATKSVEFILNYLTTREQ
jgi:geranylgeranyl pyrophosphate synthase